ncbi:glycosyltransferase [Photobacterium leiognathi]|uniref:glycosyltransferase n=1 Tax=Photobacterium leiognathi TaxID=553611 RepID=UPI002980BEF7|nr:glycosyltransferase [Photobacterium leiognathi]
MNKIAVALSIYKSDQPEYIKKAIESILTQRDADFDLYIKVDGKVPDEIHCVLNKYISLNNVFIDFHSVNKGLAFRLNQIIKIALDKNKYDFLARMDADDISYPERFSTQVSFLIENQGIAVVGSSVIEFNENGSEKLKEMFTSHDELYFNIIKRCPFNHPTVMFNLNVIDEKDIIYDDRLLNTQDYYLWVELLKKGYRFSNIEKPLLRFRINSDFYNRRGLKKAINDTKARYHAMKILKLFTLSNISHTVLLFLLRISPSFVKRIAYKYLR